MSFDLAVIAYGLPIFAEGLLNTVLFCAVAIGAGLPLAAVLALARLSRRGACRRPAIAFIEILRNTPFLVQVFLLYFALPALGLRLDATTAGLVALTAYAGAYFAEAIRGAILSVPSGQLESARALGMPYLRAVRRIVAPQMMGYLLPALTNQMIGVIKDSAVLSVITVPDMAMAAQQVLGETFAPVESYVMAAVLYWALTAAVAALMGRLETRFAAPARQPLRPLETVPAFAAER
ncbi:MAG TPA: amino acid ABC transporter permease [Stellaceae bacterium]|nr:amino acid ABC transporter permease [Stellaceae bacterium]